MTKVKKLTEHHGPVTVVGHLRLSVRPRHVTGFLGPHGAGGAVAIRVALPLTDDPGC